MVVVDASIIVEAMVVGGPARQLLGTEALHVPHLADAEVLQVIRRHVHARRLSPDAATLALKAWRRLGVRRHAMVGSLGRMWTLRDNLTAYDAAYVALAERLGCPLVTTDARLARAPGIGCSVSVLPAG